MLSVYLGDLFGPSSISLTSLLIIKKWLLLMGNGFRYCSIQLSVPTEACLKSGKSYPSRRVILAPPHFRHLFLLQKATYLQGYWGYPEAYLLC